MSSSTSWTGAVAFGLSIALTHVFLQSDMFFHRKPLIKGLFIYPIKSCKGIRVSSALITRRGLQYDRAFMLVASDGTFITQRKYAKMALIAPVILHQEEVMVITAPGMPELRVSLRTPSGPTQKVKVWSDICDAVEITDNNCQQWFATFLNAPDVKLVRMADSFVRKTDPKFAPNGQTSFADGYPFLLASEGSLEDLNSKMDKPITMERFRPNIVVGNCAPFAEDAWKTIKLHSKEAVDIVMNLVKPCSRCGIPNIDPLTAQSHPAPTNAMNTYRTGAKLSLDPSWKSKVFFGQNVDHEGQEGFTLYVGSDVTIVN